MKGSDSIHDLMGMQDPSAVGPPFAQAEGVKRAVFAVIVLSVAMVWWWPRPWAAASDMPSQAELQRRDEALAGAKIFDRKAELQVGDVGLAVDFSKDPNQDLINPQLTTCTFVPTDTSGTTPKFDCRLQGGEKIKVKYGWTREIPVEVAATRLLHALGFGADQMSRVAVVRCFGCVVSPFHVRALAQMLHLGDAFDRHISYNHAIDFVNVAVERKLQGNGVEAGARKGWDFHELAKIAPARGGASRAEVDALRLMAVFLNHWDNKGPNQRLLCEGDQKAPCNHPLAMIQDTGSDLGPNKQNLDNWRHRHIWSDDATCGVSMKGLPYDGGTFQDARISEAGRRLLGGRLTQISHQQIRALFTSAGFDHVAGWAAAFEDKVRQISDRKPCSL